MEKLSRYVLVFILLIVLLYSFSASYSYDNIDNLAYVVAMGIDSADNGKIKVSFQFTDTSAFADDGNSGDSSTVINTVTARSIESSVNLLNSYIGKNVNLAHCKVIVFSETVAKEGVSGYINSLINDSQIRPTSNIVISRCDAKYYIENSVSKSENIITKYYEVFPNSSDYTGYISNVSLGEFFNQMMDKTRDPVAILGGVNSGGGGGGGSVDGGGGDGGAQPRWRGRGRGGDGVVFPGRGWDSVAGGVGAGGDADAVANESSIDGERGTENVGLAVFKGDALVGELTALEALSRSIIDNEVSSFLISLPNPNSEQKSLDLSCNQYKKPKISIDTSNGSPYISVDVYLFAKILSVDNDNDYLNNDFLNAIAKSTDNYLSSRLTEYLYKTSTEFRACINDFDKYAMKDFLTSKDWTAYDWVSSYPTAVFEVRSHTKVNSSLLLTDS